MGSQDQCDQEHKGVNRDRGSTQEKRVIVGMGIQVQEIYQRAVASTK